MKVFLSWSGHKSHEVALALRDWLPSVIQTIQPYVSSEDIDKGARWSTDIAKELEDSTFGILCVTKENIEAPWLLFEAGALSKMMDKSSVCPFIFDLKRAEVKGPILQFQSTIFEKSDVKKLIFSINKACGESSLKEEFLGKTFDVWWPTLEDNLNKITGFIDSEKADENVGKGISSEILEEILELSRTNQKILRNPEMLLPPDYIQYALKEKSPASKKQIMLFEKQRHLSLDTEHRLMSMREIVENYLENSKPIDEQFYNEFRRLMDMILHQNMLTRENYDRLMMEIK